MSVAAEIVRMAKTKGVLLATAESCTGGMIATAITDIAGSSAVFERGVVTYSNVAKVDLLDVSPATLETFGAVSEQVAGEMALGARVKAAADIAVSVTGIAGPGGSEFKPEGRVCFGIASVAGRVVETVEFGALGRDQVRRAACNHALHMILTELTRG
jgi:nicotinamide-nucleotide amidase